MYLWGADSLRIKLGNRSDFRIRVIYWMEFLIAIGMASIFVLQSLRLDGGWRPWLINMGACTMYAIASYRFFSRMFFYEEIIISQSHFQIVRYTPFARLHQSFDWRLMGPLQYIGKDDKTDHPLKGSCYDYFGFDTQEKLIQDLHHDGNLFFEYRGKPIRFARNIYSWHAEEIVRMIQLYAGHLLVIDESLTIMLQESERDEIS